LISEEDVWKKRRKPHCRTFGGKLIGHPCEGKLGSLSGKRVRGREVANYTEKKKSKYGCNANSRKKKNTLDYGKKGVRARR